MDPSVPTNKRHDLSVATSNSTCADKPGNGLTDNKTGEIRVEEMVTMTLAEYLR